MENKKRKPIVAAILSSLAPGIVAADHCFVLGDNRDKSMDSRRWDSLLIKNIKGKPLYIYWARDIIRIGMKIK